MRRNLLRCVKRLWYRVRPLLLIGISACNNPDTAYIQGYIEGEYVYVSSAAGGTLRRMCIEKGTTVTNGQLLYVLDPMPEQAQRNAKAAATHQAAFQHADLEQPRRPPEIQAAEARVMQARAQKELAAIEFHRQEALRQDDATTEDLYDRARFTYEQQKALLDQALANLQTAHLAARSNRISAALAGIQMATGEMAAADWRLAQKKQTAPASAFVFDTLYRTGEYVAAGHPVVALLPPTNIKLRFFVKQPLVEQIKTGQQVSFSYGKDRPKISATVNYISPRAEFTPPVIFSRDTNPKLIYMIEATIAKDAARSLHPGQPVEVEL
jgi:HlyD family secretion protein